MKTINENAAICDVSRQGEIFVTSVGRGWVWGLPIYGHVLVPLLTPYFGKIEKLLTKYFTYIN